MNIILGLLLSVYNYSILLKDEAKGIIMFCVLLVCCPIFTLGDISLQYGYLFLPFLILWYLQNKGNRLKIGIYFKPLVFVMCWVIFATMISVIADIGDSVAIFSIIGTIRYLIILYILSQTKALQDNFLKIVGLILIINAIVLLVEYYLLKLWGYERVVNTWMQMFGTMGNTGSLQRTLELGAMGRLHGTFTSSSYVGSLSVLGIGLFLIKYFSDHKWTSFGMVMLSVFCGLCSSSKRFFLGGVAIFVFSLFIKSLWIKAKDIDYKLPIVFAIVFICVSTLFTALHDILYLDYYVQYLLNGDVSGSLDSRFGEDGIVNSMIPYIKEYWLTGLGEITIKNVLVTDSEFYCTLFKSGIVGVIVYVILFLRLLGGILKKKARYAAIAFFVIILEYFISTQFYSSLGILLLSFVIGRIASQKKLTYKRI